MKHIEDGLLTDLSVPAFEKILKGKLKGLLASKTIVGVESVKQGRAGNVPCFNVRIIYGERGYLDLVITSQRKVGLDGSLLAKPEDGHWAGTAFASFVEGCITAKTQPVRGNQWQADAQALRHGQTALFTGGRH